MSFKFLELFPGTVEFKGNSIESIESEDLQDLSKDYSVSFWILLNKVMKGRQVTVYHKGDNSNSQPTISLHERSLLVKFDTVRSGSERIFANAEIEVKKWTHVVFTVSQNEYIEAKLYVNGKLDSSISIKNEILHCNSKCYIGKDPWNHGFIGSIGEPLLFFDVLVAEDILAMYQQGIENYKHSQVFRTSQFFYEKRSSDSSPSKYFSENSKILDEGISIKTNDLSLIAMSRFERLDQFFHKNPKIYGKVAHLVSHYDWLATIYRTLRAVYPVLRDEEGNIENKLEIGRMLPPISQLNLQISKNELVTLAKVTKCHSVITYDKIPSWNGQEKDELIHYLDLLEILKRYLENIEMGEDLNISQLGGNQPEIDQIYSASEEFLSNKNGSFELSIDFCVNCKRHQTSTRHNEREIANWYNEVLGNILEEFPACEIIGNKYGPASIGTFGVYIEGIGNDLYKDNFGRLKIYKRKNEKPNSRQILDAIYLVSFIYENPQNLANLQAEYKRTHSENPKHQDMIVGQARVSEETALDKSHVDNLIELQSETIMYCKNWGCVVKIYQNGKNHKKACRYHPGKWEFGSIHSLWPEHWTCCRGDWESDGCTNSFHKGVVNSFVYHKCLNHGENNPYSLSPDSFCGKSFADPSTCGKTKPDISCFYHSGHKESRDSGSIWTCCNLEVDSMISDNSHCVEGQHAFAEYPNEEAKIYFVTKKHKNPGLDRNIKSEAFSKTAPTSRFFNTDIKPYVNPYDRKKNKEILDSELRYCLNCACENSYKEIDNHDKACTSHPGYWDFGHSGLLKGSEIIVLWEPHWSCCGLKWESLGCTQTRHSGPLLAKMETRKWKWPSEGAKRYFNKKVSGLWQQKLNSEHITQRLVSLRYDQVCSENNVQKLTGSLLHRLCVKLHLHILCVSEDMSFMYKYQDVLSGQAQGQLQDRYGYISKEGFIDWWFSPLERIRPEMGS